MVGPGLLIAGVILLVRRDRRGWKLVGLDAAAVGVSLIALVLKHVIVHPVPPDTRPAHRHPVVTIANTPYGYPSGHTMRTTLLAGMLLRGARSPPRRSSSR